MLDQYQESGYYAPLKCCLWDRYVIIFHLLAIFNSLIIVFPFPSGLRFFGPMVLRYSFSRHNTCLFYTFWAFKWHLQYVGVFLSLSCPTQCSVNGFHMVFWCFALTVVWTSVTYYSSYSEICNVNNKIRSKSLQNQDLNIGQNNCYYYFCHWEGLFYSIFYIIIVLISLVSCSYINTLN